MVEEVILIRAVLFLKVETWFETERVKPFSYRIKCPLSTCNIEIALLKIHKLILKRYMKSILTLSNILYPNLLTMFRMNDLCHNTFIILSSYWRMVEVVL